MPPWFGFALFGWLASNVPSVLVFLMASGASQDVPWSCRAKGNHVVRNLRILLAKPLEADECLSRLSRTAPLALYV